MTTKTEARYRKKAVAILRELSESRLLVALDFLEYLREKEDWEATWEILADKRAMSNITEAEEDLKAERWENFVPWEKTRRSA